MELGWIDVNVWLLWFVTVGIISCPGTAVAAEVCRFQEGVTSMVVLCEDGCCQSGCCSSGPASADYALILIIVGAVAGVVVSVLVIVAVVCLLKDRQRAQRIDGEKTNKPDDQQADQDARLENQRPSIAGTETILVTTQDSGQQVRRKSRGSRTMFHGRHSDAFLPQLEEVDESKHQSVADVKQIN